MTERRLTVQQPAEAKEEEPQLTQQQISELLETEGARTLVEAAEERGHVEPTELEAFALEHELEEADVEQLTRELEAIGLEVGEPPAEEVVKPEPKAPAPITDSAGAAGAGIAADSAGFPLGGPISCPCDSSSWVSSAISSSARSSSIASASRSAGSM